MNDGISAFLRMASSAPSDMVDNQALTSLPRAFSPVAESRTDSGILSISDSEAPFSDSLILSAISMRISSSFCENWRQLARVNAVSSASSPAHVRAMEARTTLGTEESTPSSAGSASRQIATAPAPNSNAPYKHTRPLISRGNSE